MTRARCSGSSWSPRIQSVKDPERPPENDSEKLTQNGEAGYCGRMFLGHLYEAGNAFRSLESTAPTWITKAAAGDAQAVAALERLREVFNTPKKGGFRGFLYRIRNNAVFHYDEAPFRDALDATNGDTELVIGEYAGFSRFAVIDSLMDDPLKKAAQETGIDFAAALGRAIQLGDDLETLVSRLLIEYLEERPDTWQREALETLRVPPALEKEAIARRARREGQSTP